VIAVSWGGHESLVIPKCSGTPISEFNPEDPEHRYVRLFVSLEEADYLIKDLDQAIEKMNNN
jgi:cystathionine beta-lyase/cystathionine gamma-synthase